MINGHGDDLHLTKAGIKYNFSSNMNPWGNAALQQHLRNQLDKISNYPDPLAENLATAIEQKHQLCTKTVLVCNGAVEAFYILAQHYRNKQSLVLVPSFAEYEDACVAANHRVTYLHHSLMPETELSRFDLVWLCNPNNPDGKIWKPEYLKELLANNPGTTFIVDEAYTHFTEKPLSIQDKVEEYKNLIVVASLTKRYAMPGLRLGYLVCNSELLEKLKHPLMPWRINALALEGGLFCMNPDFSDYFNVNAFIKESKRMQEALASIPGFEVVASDTSFFLAKAPAPAYKLKEFLIENFGMLIRDASNFRSLSEQHFRVSVKMPQENKLLINAIETWSNTL